MRSKTALFSVGLSLAATTLAQSTTTATVLLPDWCVTQSAPTVTVLGQDALTTYSYSCSINSAAVSSASAKASSIAESARNKASELKASLATLTNPKPTETPEDRDKRDSSYECYGQNAFDACIPWEITQGASFWAVHYTVTDMYALDQECTFGEGGIDEGPATCTASGRLDPQIWGNGDGSHTETFAKSEVDEFFVRNTVQVTVGGAPAATESAGSSTPASVSNPRGTGDAGQLSLAAWLMGAGGILAAALAL